MTDLEVLDKIDLLRERLDISYQEAKTALDNYDGNVVDALIAAERAGKSRYERYFVRGGQLVDKAKELLHQANVTRIRVKQADRIVMEIPATAGVVGTVVAPGLTILGTMAALAAKCQIEVERPPAKAMH